MTIIDAIEQLKAYQGPDMLTLRGGASDEMISQSEKALKITFPDDFKIFYHFANGFEAEEDLFNMMPLNEISHNEKLGKSSFYIAEYMTYCDMWELKINPKDPNDYDISYGELHLTKSLAEFISRFLKGGVFEKQGLYFWRDEVKAKINGPTKPDALRELLGVFYLGLIKGIISIKEVKDWADHIILTEDEPDYFFIELTLAKDADELITVLNDKWPITNSVIVLRVLLGVLYYQLKYLKVIEPQKVITILYSLTTRDILTSEESGSIYNLEDAFDYQPDEALTELLEFLERYSSLNLHNYDNWCFFNNKIEEKLAESELDDMIEERMAIRSAQSKPGGVFRLAKATGIIVIMLVILCLLIYIIFKNISNVSDTHLLFMVPLFLVIPFVNLARILINKIYNE